MRGPGESYSEGILRLLELERGSKAARDGSRLQVRIFSAISRS
jgi:hypothetical protein